MYAVVIFALWNVPGARVLINPLKLLTIGWHELCHITMVRLSVMFSTPPHSTQELSSLTCQSFSCVPQAILTGGTVTKVAIDPDLGGATHVEGGIPVIILSAGYLGSTLFGGVLVLAGFDTLVSKIMSFIIALGLLLPLVVVRDKL